MYKRNLITTENQGHVFTLAKKKLDNKVRQVVDKTTWNT